MANTLTFANQTITDAHIFGGVSFLVDLNSGEEFTIGNTASASVSFVTDIQLPLYSKDSTNGTFTWEKDEVSRGRFYITEVTKEADKYSVTAYDAMVLLDKVITTLSITYPVTASALATQIATYMGCTVSGTINNGSLSVASLDGLLTIRAALSYIAEASGCSVKVDGSDHLCFMYYEDSEVTKTASEYVSLNTADYTCAAIDNVTIFNSEGEIQATAGTGTNTLYIGQNPFLEEATTANATAIYNAVKDFEYTPLKCELFDDTDIEVGTIVTFGTTPTLVMHLDSSESGAFASSVGSDTRAGYNKSALEVVGEARAIAVDAQAAAGMVSGILSGMQTAAQAAGTTLNGIYATAEESKGVLEDMQTAATQAGTTLEGIYQDAEDAKTSADSAANSAQSASERAEAAGRAAALAQAAADVAQGEIDEQKEWFWHDTLGSHILGADSGYRTDIDSTGMRIVESATQDTVSEFSINNARLGKANENNVHITDQRFELISDGNVTAYIEGERFKVSDAQITNLYMKTQDATTGDPIGALGWVMRSNGHLSLRRLK